MKPTGFFQFSVQGIQRELVSFYDYHKKKKKSDLQKPYKEFVTGG